MLKFMQSVGRNVLQQWQAAEHLNQHFVGCNRRGNNNTINSTKKHRKERANKFTKGEKNTIPIYIEVRILGQKLFLIKLHAYVITALVNL